MLDKLGEIMNKIFISLTLFLTLLVSISKVNAMSLNLNRSSLSFISIKKGHIAEINYFKKFALQISDQGLFQLSIDLSSVDTGIPLRDSRIRQHVFETNRFSEAIFQGKVNSNLYRNLKPGQYVNTVISGSLHLHGLTQKLQIAVNMTQLADGQLHIMNTTPILLDGNWFHFKKGIEKLKSIAHLKEINMTIPISFDIYLRN